MMFISKHLSPRIIHKMSSVLPSNGPAVGINEKRGREKGFINVNAGRVVWSRRQIQMPRRGSEYYDWGSGERWIEKGVISGSCGFLTWSNLLLIHVKHLTIKFLLPNTLPNLLYALTSFSHSLCKH